NIGVIGTGATRCRRPEGAFFGLRIPTNVGAGGRLWALERSACLARLRDIIDCRSPKFGRFEATERRSSSRRANSEKPRELLRRDGGKCRNDDERGWFEMLNLEVRKKLGGGEVHRLDGAAITIGASSGNEVVVRARGVAGRHVRISEREGAYQLDLYKGASLISVNGREFGGGPIGVGDRITIGEATITVLNAQPTVSRLIAEIPIVAPGAPASSAAGPSTAVEFRDLRLAVYRI